MTKMRTFWLCVGLAASGVILPAHAQTDTNRISVAQIMQAVEPAPTNQNARQTLSAYLSGIGETAGILMSRAEESGASLAGCRSGISLSGDTVAAALAAAVPDQSKWASTPAAPIIVADMLARAGCR